MRSDATQAIINHHHSGILDLAPRSGKTKIAIDAVRDFEGNILVIYPYNIIGDNWTEEMKRWNSRPLVLSNQRSIPDEKFDLIIADEIHSLSENQIKKLKGNKILGLTGSLSASCAKLLKQELGLDVIFEYSIEQAINDGVISNYIIHVVRVPLDSKDRYVKVKDFHTTELKNYEYLTAQFEKFREDDRLKMIMAGKRARALYSYQSKINATKQFIKDRCLVFTVLHTAANQLCEHQYHSKSKGDELERFINGEIDQLAVCNMVSMGKLLPLILVII